MELDFESAFEGLLPEEAKVLKDKIVSAVSGTIQAHKAERMQPLIEEYRQKLRSAPRGVVGNTLRATLKAQYRTRGVSVDSVDFS